MSQAWYDLGDTISVQAHADGATSYYFHEKLERNSHGTGDLYASAFVGALMQGFGVCEAAGIAADFAVESMKKTLDDPDHWYGVKFEKALPGLIARVNRG